MQLSPAAFNNHLTAIGQDFGWRKAQACPCLTTQTGQPKPTCPHCSGKGRIWGDVITGKSGIVARSQMKKYAQFGVWDDGDIMLSIPSDSPLYAIGQFDRVIALNKTESFSVNILAGINAPPKFIVLSVESVSWVSGDSLVYGSLPDINDDGTLDWPVTGSPPAGITYALTGIRRPEYFCWLELPADRPEHSGFDLPRRVALRRLDIFQSVN